MLEIKFVRQNFSDVQKALSARGDITEIDNLKSCDARRREILIEIEKLRHNRNVVTDRIASMKKTGEDAESLIFEMREVSKRIKELDISLSEYEEELNTILLGLPNIPHSSVPVGKDSLENPVIKKASKLPEFGFEPKAHWDLGKKLGILDFDRAARITGARFPLYFAAGARLERALINFMLDLHTTEHGYKEVLPPFMVNRTSMTHTGQLPKLRRSF